LVDAYKKVVTTWAVEQTREVQNITTVQVAAPLAAPYFS
jgi:hypothetical protein